jgi:hypothetical protein
VAWQDQGCDEQPRTKRGKAAWPLCMAGSGIAKLLDGQAETEYLDNQPVEDY